MKAALFLLFSALATAALADPPIIDATVATIGDITAPQGIALNLERTFAYVASGSNPSLAWSATKGCQGTGVAANTGTVAIVNTSTRTKVADLFEPGRPVHAELDPSTGNVHVAVSPAGVSVYFGTSRTRSASSIGGAPHDIGIDPGLGYAVVSNTFDTSGLAANQTYVSLTEVATGRAIADINTSGFGPHKVAVDPARHLAYVSHAEAPQVDVIDMRTGTLLRKLTTGVASGSAQNAIDLVRRRLYVIGDNGSAQGKLVAIDLATEQPIATVLLPYPHAVRVDPQTGLVWVPLAEAGPASPAYGLVSVLDPDSLAERARMKVGHCPYYLDFDKTSRTAYVTNEADNSLSVVDMKQVPPGLDADRVFNWAEVNYPQYFPTRYGLSGTALGYYYRYYAQSNIYLGTANGRVYVYGPTTFGPDILDVGGLAEFAQQAKAAGF